MFQLSDMKAKDKPTCFHLGHWYSVWKDYIIDITPAGLIWHTHETELTHFTDNSYEKTKQIISSMLYASWFAFSSMYVFNLGKLLCTSYLFHLLH